MASVILQGTGSDVGKSILAAGLCRIFTQMGLKVRPFKAQNMSNNACPTIDGGEIGRAQALQALACGAAPHTDMNPILLKPQSDRVSQMIVQGKVCKDLEAKDFLTGRARLLELALESFRRLRRESDLVIAEGGGSPAEINLRSGDIVNMGFARPAQMPVILVGDINRGGVIASLVGTKAVLDPEDAERIQGFIVNQFRGELSLFDEGNQAIARMTGWQALGVVPWIEAARQLPQEDAIPDKPRARGEIKIAVPVLPHIANFDDFDALEAEETVYLQYVYPGRPLPGDAALIILPGSKTTISDLAFFKAQDWDIDLMAHIRRGGYVLGICGGYQMLGKTIADPMGVEGAPGTVDGLGLLAVHTVLGDEKRVTDVEGVSLTGEIPFQGYEIHMGRTELEEGARPLLRRSDGTLDGAVSADGRIAGCYIHRLFDGARQRAHWMGLLSAASDGMDQAGRIQTGLDQLAAALRECLDIEAILKIAQKGF